MDLNMIFMFTSHRTFTRVKSTHSGLQSSSIDLKVSETLAEVRNFKPNVWGNHLVPVTKTRAALRRK